MAEEELHRQHEALQARDKVVLKMTRDGAAEENLTQDSTERISQRPEDAVFQREEEPPVSEEAPASHKPSQQLYYSETAKMAAPQFSAPPPPEGQATGDALDQLLAFGEQFDNIVIQ